MLSDLRKIKVHNLIIASLILLPLFIISYISFVPEERAATKRDIERKNTVNALVRAVEVYKNQNSFYPNEETCGETWVSKCLRDSQIIDYSPSTVQYIVGGKSCGGENGYCIKTNADKTETVIYTELEALANRDYCPENSASMVYSSVEKRTDIVCGEVKPGPQKFVR